MTLAILAGALVAANAGVALLWDRSATLLELLLSAVAVLAGMATANMLRGRRERRYRNSVKDSALW